MTMGWLCFGLFILGLITSVAMQGRGLWDKEYREGVRTRREWESWKAGYEKGGSGCGLLLLLILLICLLMTSIVEAKQGGVCYWPFIFWATNLHFLETFWN